MLARIFSPVVSIGTYGTFAATSVLMLSSSVLAQSGYYTDDATGIVYQQVTRTIDRPVVETQVEQKEQTVYRPQTVTESTPQMRTIYTPVVEYNWEPRVHGRWNPFQSPTIAYHHVPRARWEAKSEVVQRTSTRTEWVAETRTIEVPRNLVRMQREQKVDYHPVGRIAPGSGSSPSSSIASRLRPIDPGARIEPIGLTYIASNALTAPRVAASTAGRLASDPPQRTASQSGIRATDLGPRGGVQGSTLPPIGTTGIATLPAPPIFR
jgi:hypothetical protein